MVKLTEWIRQLLSPTSTGAWGERLAAQDLRKKGYQIVARNYRAGQDELDIIAKEEGQLVFVEVRTRNTDARVPGAHTINTRKGTALRRAAKRYLAEQTTGGASWRFDVVEISYKSRKDYDLHHYQGVRV